MQKMAKVFEKKGGKGRKREERKKCTLILTDGFFFSSQVPLSALRRQGEVRRWRREEAVVPAEGGVPAAVHPVHRLPAQGEGGAGRRRQVLPRHLRGHGHLVNCCQSALLCVYFVALRCSV